MYRMTEPIIGVYKITCLSSGKYYIGYSKNVKRRFSVHKRGLKRNKHQNQHLQRSYNKYNIEKFTFDILHTCNTIDEAKELELKYLEDINIRQFLYNMHYNNSGGDTLTNHPDRTEIIEKIKVKRQLQTNFRKDAPIVIDGVKYDGITDAGTKLNIPSRTIQDRIHSSSPKFTNYKYLDETHTKEAQDKMRLRIENKKKQCQEFSTGKGVPLIIDNIYYESVRAAAKVIGIDKNVISKRIKSKEPQYVNYQYANLDKDVYIKTTRIRPVIINNIYYESLSAAGRELGINHVTIRNRIKSPNPMFADYKYADDRTNEIAS
jgi:predicted GIY-YIG superfamily endonuclease